ncbi:MAG: peroxidase family protein [Verrucomicrobiales bacterium]|nr:peroxidase family protein [Verrucomicrobiales bacterium]
MLSLDTDGINDYRTADGSGNNPGAPNLGITDSPLIRIATPGYGDAIDLPRGVAVEDEGNGDVEVDEQSLPSARRISNFVHDQGSQDIPSKNDLNQLFFQFGQFLSHDTGLSEPNGSLTTGAGTGLSGNEFFPVEVEAGDPDFLFPEIGLTRTISKSAASSASGYREQINTITSFIDGSNIYGSDLTRANLLRSFFGGKMKVQAGPDGDLPPFNTFGLTNANNLGLPETSLFAAGDVRANEQIGLTAFHTLFLREHNRLADEIAAYQFPYDNLSDPAIDEEIYQRARAIVGALLQKITYHEWLPALLGKHALNHYGGYDPNVDPSISNEFSTAAFRIGHTMLPSEYQVLDDFGTATPVALQNAFFNPDFLSAYGVSGIIRGQALYRQQELDRFVVDDVRNFLFGPGFGGLDLAALNIQRGRDHGIPSYNAVRAAFGLGERNGFEEVTGDYDSAFDALEQAYGAGAIDELDLWTGGLSEPHLPGSNLGETFSRIFVDQFTRLRDGDRFYFENSDIYPSHFVQLIFDTTLTDIIRRNTTINDHELNGYAFYIPGAGSDFHQTDLRIGTDKAPYLHKGNDIYNLSAAGQTVRNRAPLHGAGIIHVSVENDGNAHGTTRLQTNRLSRKKFQSRYIALHDYGRENISAQIVSGQFYKDLDPGEILQIQSRVRVRNPHYYRRLKANLLFTAFHGDHYDAGDKVKAMTRFRGY